VPSIEKLRCYCRSTTPYPTGIVDSGSAPWPSYWSGRARVMADTTVSQILLERYTIEAKPGAKAECPFCHRPYFYIKGDDSLGKCFEPSCLRFITLHGPGGSETISLSSVLADIYHDFHQELLRLKDANYVDNAYHYLAHDRKIHPRVIEDAMLGAIPGGGYAVEEKFQPLLESIAQTPRPKPRGRPKKFKDPTLEERVQWMTAQRDKLLDCILKHAGWLAFFYTDAYHRIVAIKFRKPGTRVFTSFKPYKANGLFGHGLFTPYELNGDQTYNEYLLVTEGDLNPLQLQSLLVRRSEALGKDSGYLFACATGGVDSTDWAAVQRLVKTPILVHDHDPAGERWVSNARQLMAVDACTTPLPSNDLDEYIRAFGDRHAEAWDAVKSLLKGRERRHRLYSGTGAEFFDGSRFVPKRLGDAIMERHHIKYAAELLWVYRDGVYRAEGEQAVKQECHALLGEQRTEGHIQETLRYIEVETYAKLPEANADSINLRNGRLDWRTRQLSPHTPEIFDIWQLPVTYDAAATCPEITQYFNTTFTDDVIPLVEEITGYVIPKCVS
jgi:hypothetical protein